MNNVHPLFAPILDAIAPPRPVIVSQCPYCHGSGIFSQDYADGRCTSSACTNCAGKGYVATESGEA